MEKMGQRGKSTLLGLPQIGRPHYRVYLAKSSTTYTSRPHNRGYLTAWNTD
ncbi:hypothetical protein F383_09763 [Gossypium arboreum]|uniref:Uncharacterized protein n=1 Tax=Gossypium arboreum TaxID=29729 RepID=A0A0B0P368_GOSAR|nr:hypothetical protein F383_09763 [Gossypium arboreum]